MTLFCITTMIDGVRDCTVRGHHLPNCVHTDDFQCVGCLPRPAETGLLCRSCWEKFEQALSVAADMIPHLRSIEKGPTSVDGVRTSVLVQPTVPATWLEADALWADLVGVAVAYSMEKNIPEPVWDRSTSVRNVNTFVLEGFSNAAPIEEVLVAVREVVAWIQVEPENIVSRMRGAESAVRFYREMQRALAMYPVEEQARQLPRITCRTCGQDTLWQRPPLDFPDDIVVQCSNERCGAMWDPQMAAFDMRLYMERVATQIGSSRNHLARELAKMLDPVLASEVVAVCVDHAPADVYRLKVNKFETERCVVCDAVTTAGLYVGKQLRAALRAADVGRAA